MKTISPASASTHLTDLFNNNKAWAEKVTRADPEFFKRLEAQQNPNYLWIGCSDSRVPANEIVGLRSGELFVHRNVGNVVVHSDLNCLAVLQFAIDHLKVRHIIVCGHYGCSAVRAVREKRRLGLVDNWLRHIQDVVDRYDESHADDGAILSENALCELNVIDQVCNVAESGVVLDAWARGQPLMIHGMVYALSDGLLRDMEISVDSTEALKEAKKSALGRIA